MGELLVALGAAFLIAGVLARFGRRLGLPTIPLFMAAGIICGPNTPGIVLIDDPAQLGVLASLGLILLLFHLGLEFSVDEFVHSGRSLFVAGGIFIAFNITAGLALGFGLNWGDGEALVIAGIVGISSSAIATKLLIELRRQAAANVGLTVLARGEFSLILASLALAAGLDGRLSPFTGLYVLVLAIAGPILSAKSSLLARVLPRALDRRAEAVPRLS